LSGQRLLAPIVNPSGVAAKEIADRHIKSAQTDGLHQLVKLIGVVEDKHNHMHALIFSC